MSDQRRIGINVLTDDIGLSHGIYSQFCELAGNLRPVTLDHVSVYNTKVDEEFEVEEDATEYHDENTLALVRSTLANTQLFVDRGWPGVDEIIIALQNAGILFRQRR